MARTYLCPHHLPSRNPPAILPASERAEAGTPKRVAGTGLNSNVCQGGLDFTPVGSEPRMPAEGTCLLGDEKASPALEYLKEAPNSEIYE